MKAVLRAALPILVGCATEIRPEEATQADTVSAIPRGSEWRYWDGGGDLGTSWRDDFDDASWSSGAGPLGHGESYLRTTVDSGPVTTYFRHTVAVEDPAAITGMVGEVMYDDGFVVYLNGTEIERAAMPDGAVTASTLSSGHEANQAYESYDWTSHIDLLVAGTNTIAVEVHQASSTSSDLVFDLGLTLDTGPPRPPVDMGGIARRSYWDYRDVGGEPDPSWKTQLYGQWPDWKQGYAPLGYGESYLATTVDYGGDPANKHITTHFTHSFYTDNPGAVTSMIAEAMYDDGFVAYLNGVEVARRAMPPGPVTSTTLSTGHETGETYETIDLSSRVDLLIAGHNVLAVEVHQLDRSSSDLVFDMALLLAGEEPAPPEAGEDIARGSTWRYWDRPASPSGDIDLWTLPYFNDAQWETGAGPLGYGETYLATAIDRGPMTTYFRRWFTVDDPSVETRLIAELMVDDGAVVYLNGNEIARLHMPEGPIDHDTRANRHEARNRYARYNWSQYSGYLVAGPNLLAVEVHQSGPRSDDLVFDLSLAVRTPAACRIPGGGPGDPPAPADRLTDVWVGPTAVFAVGDAGTIGRRDASGAWCWAKVRPETSWNAVWGSADDDVWMVGDDGAVLHYDGVAFSDVDAGTSSALLDVWGSGAGDVWVVGDDSQVRRLDGATWANLGLTLPAGQNLRAIWGASADDVWISGWEEAPYPGDPNYDGTSGVIYRWNTASSSWTLELKDTMYYGFADFGSLHGTSASDVWAVGSDHPAGAACTISGLRHWDGTSWHFVEGAPVECRSFDDVAAGAPGAEDGVWVVGNFDGGQDGGAVRYTGGAWQEVTSPRGFTAIDHRGDRMWAVGELWDDGFRQFIVRWDGTAFVREW